MSVKTVVNIIPTYNEKENIGLMLEALQKIARDNPRYKFLQLVVDDLSPDGTLEIVKKYAKKDKSIHLITGPKKGLGHALIRGYQYAADSLGAEVIIPNDCDFSFAPEKIIALLQKIDEGYDVVVASRHVGKGGTQGWSLFRKLNHWVSNVFFATLIAGIKEVKDHNGNFKAIRVKGVLDKVPLAEMLRKDKVRGFGFQAYILYELSKVTQKFYEVPVVFKFRIRGEAKIGAKYLKSFVRDVFEYMKLAILIRLERNNRFFKFAIVGGTGLVIQTLIYYFLGFILRLVSPSFATIIAGQFAIVSNFTLNNHWTFKEEKISQFSKLITKFLQFWLTSNFAVIVLQGGTVRIGEWLVGQESLLIHLFFFTGLVITLLWNYTIYNRFIWKTKSEA